MAYRIGNVRVTLTEVAIAELKSAGMKEGAIVAILHAMSTDEALSGFVKKGVLTDAGVAEMRRRHEIHRSPAATAARIAEIFSRISKVSNPSEGLAAGLDAVRPVVEQLVIVDPSVFRGIGDFEYHLRGLERSVLAERAEALYRAWREASKGLVHNELARRVRDRVSAEAGRGNGENFVALATEALGFPDPKKTVADLLATGRLPRCMPSRFRPVRVGQKIHQIATPASSRSRAPQPQPEATPDHLIEGDEVVAVMELVGWDAKNGVPVVEGKVDGHRLVLARGANCGPRVPAIYRVVSTGRQYSVVEYVRSVDEEANSA